MQNTVALILKIKVLKYRNKAFDLLVFL